MRIKQKDIDRFWSKVKKQDSCWGFNSAADRDGYHATSYIDVNGTRRKVGAHRFMMMVLGHVIPPGHVVCHHCDNPGCVNPNHLFIGTVNDNNQDKVRKGRQSSFPGSKNGQAKLDEITARKIKQETVVGNRSGYNNGSNVRAIANKYNVHVETVRLIARGITWSHI